jgi:hypothetical protein
MYSRTLLFRSSCPNRDLPRFVPTLRKMRRRYASWSGRRRWSLSHMRTTAVNLFSSNHCSCSLNTDTLLSLSVLSSRDSRHMDCRLFHLRSVHELVAKLRIRDPELDTRTAGLFRPSCTHHVLRRLVMPPTTFPPLPFLLDWLLKRERIITGKTDRSLKRRPRKCSDA